MTVILAGDELAARLRDRLPHVLDEVGEPGLWVKPDAIVEAAVYLKAEPGLEMKYLNSVTAVDYIGHFEMIYHLTSFKYNHSAVVKARLYGRTDLEIPSVVEVWPGADYQEREIWDLMGVRFEGHPNMKRILLWEEFPGHPLRKDYLR